MVFLFQWYICFVLLISSSSSWAFPKRLSSQYGNLGPTVRMEIKSLQKVGVIRGGASDAPSTSSLSSTPAESGDGEVTGTIGASTKSSQEEIEGLAKVAPDASIPTELSTAVDSRGKAFFKMGPKAKSPAGFLRSTIPSLPWYAMPDYLTYMRCLAVPLLPVIYYYDPTPWHTSLLFGVASITDWLDGFLARRWDISTNFGAFLDPVADKLAVSTALILLAGNNDKTITICTAIILAREIAVSALREWMAQRSLRDTVKVGWQGKCKTAFTMLALTALLALPKQFSSNFWLLTQKVGMGLLYASTVLTLTSGAIYFRAAAPILIDGR